MQKLLTLAFAGSAGTLSRYFLGNWALQIFGRNFPYGTLTVNILGCFVIGLLGNLADKHAFLNEHLHLALFVGFLGAFTTFSSFAFESWLLLKSGQTLYASLNVFMSLAGCFLGLALGVRLGKVVS